MKKEWSLKKLKEYKGMNPCPSDFVAFWKKTRKEIAKDIPIPQITKAGDEDFETIEIYDLQFTSFDGALIYAKYIRPKTTRKVPCVLQFHGYPGSSRSFFEQASFVDAGFAVIAMDCRGQGGKSQDAGGIVGTTASGHVIAGLDGPIEDMLYCKIYKDVYLISRIAENMKGIDKKQLFVNGASQGGALGLVCCALNNKIKKAAILYPFLSDFKRVYELGCDEIAYEGLRYYNRWFDPQGIREEEIFTRLGYIDVKNFAELIECEILFGISLADVVCPPSSQFAAYNNLIAEKQVHLYPDKGHEHIDAFDDRIIPFFLKRNKNEKKWGSILCLKEGFTLKHKAKDKRMCTYESIIQGNRPVILYMPVFQGSGQHCLSKFSALGYDVICFDVKNREITGKGIIQAQEACYRLSTYVAEEMQQPVVFVAEGVGANIALLVASQLKSVVACLVQSPVAQCSDHNMLGIASKIECAVLMASTGLDNETNIELNKKWMSKIKGYKKHILYLKYGEERINDFEDQKMLFLNKLKKNEGR